ncbi:MAG: NAD(P)-dependent oxidoreductase [Aquihabitans sp.]
MVDPGSTRIAVLPRSADWIDAAVVEGGAEIVDIDEATALVWTSANTPDELAAVLAERPEIDWVQLPWAGVDPYVPIMDRTRTWTCAKGVYADPVAEHALTLLLAGFRHIHTFARATTWEASAGRNLIGARIAIIGGGGIAESLIRLLAPFDCSITVVRRRPVPMEGVQRVLGVDALAEGITGADALVLALPLLNDTRAMIGAHELSLLATDAWVVNVARGEVCDTGALIDALDDGDLGGVALDVTDPEPLPDGHPLWTHPDVIITPHTANTPEMARPLLSSRIVSNVRRYAAGDPLAGVVDLAVGY